MKKILCIIVCLIALIAFAGCREAEDNGSGEFYILELTENKIPDEKQFAITDADGNTVLDNNDVEKVLVVFEKSKDRYLELRLTKDGAKKFKNALKSEDAVLSITLAGKQIASPVIADDAEDNSAIVLGEYEDVMDWFNKIT